MWYQEIKRIINDLLTLLFPQEHRTSRIARITTETLHTHLHPRVLLFDTIHIHALLPYHNPLIQDLIWALKYENNTWAAELLSAAVAEYLTEELSDIIPFSNHKPLLVPVPLSKEREAERGYNQSTRIAQAVADKLKDKIKLETKGLVRTRNTFPQTSLTREKRYENVRDAFEGARNCVEGRFCILLDDVTTTGTTLKEATRALSRAGAHTILPIACTYA